MLILKAMRPVVVGMAVVAASVCQARADFVTVGGFSDIILWAGVGPGDGVNEAGFVVQFADTDAPASIAWGYRWGNSTPTMQDMMFAISGAVTGIASPPPSGLDSRLSIDLTEDLMFGNYVNSISYDQSGLPSPWSQAERLLVGDYQGAGTFTAIYIWPNANGIWDQPAADGSFVASEFGIGGLSLATGNWYSFVLATDQWPDPPLVPSFVQPVSAVPEPRTLALGAGAIVFAIGIRWRARRAK